MDIDSIYHVLYNTALISTLLAFVILFFSILGIELEDVGYFSISSFLNFLVGFSWTGALLIYKVTFPITIVASIGAGVIMLFVFYYMNVLMMKLSETGNAFKLSDAVGKSATVYLEIPSNAGGSGVVTFSYKGSVKHLTAITKGEERMQFNTRVKIIESYESLVIVEKI